MTDLILNIMVCAQTTHAASCMCMLYVCTHTYVWTFLHSTQCNNSNIRLNIQRLKEKNVLNHMFYFLQRNNFKIQYTFNINIIL